MRAAFEVLKIAQKTHPASQFFQMFENGWKINLFPYWLSDYEEVSLLFSELQKSILTL